MFKVTSVPATEDQPAKAAIELDLAGATMLHEMTEKNAASGPSAHVLAALYDASGTAKKLLQQAAPKA